MKDCLIHEVQIIYHATYIELDTFAESKVLKNMKRLMSYWYILLIYLCTKIFRKNWKAASWIFHERSLTQMPRLFFLFQKAEALLCQNLLYYSFIWKRKNAKKVLSSFPLLPLTSLTTSNIPKKVLNVRVFVCACLRYRMVSSIFCIQNSKTLFECMWFLYIHKK